MKVKVQLPKQSWIIEGDEIFTETNQEECQ